MAEFVQNFDCNNEEHVLWLKEVGQCMAKVSSGEQFDVVKLANKNPLPGKLTLKNPMDMAEIHFMLAMKYANAVLSGDAFVPTRKSEVLFEGEVSRV